jgi:hypothetical protein
MQRYFRTKDSPDAFGRQPETGEVSWVLSFPLDDGTELRVRLGEKGREAIITMLNQENEDDAQDAMG